jgi:Glycosyl hydrolase family 71
MTRAKNVKNLGLKWMQPVSVQDERPNQGIYDEAENTQNLRNTWTIARDSGADWVQIPTWNDYVEGSHIGPSVEQGWSFLDINAYYAAWFKTGSAPAIQRDTVYVSHRTQSVSARQTTPQTKTMRLRGGSAARDTVEALTFLTAPGTVTVTVGGTKHTCQVDAGVDTCVVPLGTGTVSAAVTRGGSTVAAVTSPQVVTSSPSVQDLHYVAASSRREGSSIPVSAPAAPSTPAPTVPATPRPTAPVTQNPVTQNPVTPKPVTQPAGSTSTALFPMTDTYANEGAPSTEYGSDALLVSRSGPGARAYLRFDLPQAPAGKRLTGATLRVRTASDPMAASAVAHRVRLASNDWKVAALNWNNKPSASGAVLGEVAAGAKVNSSYDVALATAPLASVLGTHQTVAIDALGNDSLWLLSNESADRNLRPQLVLTWG